jgi:hypothetical protein
MFAIRRFGEVEYSLTAFGQPLGTEAISIAPRLQVRGVARPLWQRSPPLFQPFVEPGSWKRPKAMSVTGGFQLPWEDARNRRECNALSSRGVCVREAPARRGGWRSLSRSVAAVCRRGCAEMTGTRARSQASFDPVVKRERICGTQKVIAAPNAARNCREAAASAGTLCQASRFTPGGLG